MVQPVKNLNLTLNGLKCEFGGVNRLKSEVRWSTLSFCKKKDQLTSILANKSDFTKWLQSWNPRIFAIFLVVIWMAWSVNLEAWIGSKQVPRLLAELVLVQVYVSARFFSSVQMVFNYSQIIQWSYIYL